MKNLPLPILRLFSSGLNYFSNFGGLGGLGGLSGLRLAFFAALESNLLFFIFISFLRLLFIFLRKGLSGFSGDLLADMEVEAIEESSATGFTLGEFGVEPETDVVVTTHVTEILLHYTKFFFLYENYYK